MKIEEFRKKVAELKPRVLNLLAVEHLLPQEELNTLLYIVKAFQIVDIVCDITGKDVPQAQEFLTLASDILTSWENKFINN